MAKRPSDTTSDSAAATSDAPVFSEAMEHTATFLAGISAKGGVTLDDCMSAGSSRGVQSKEEFVKRHAEMDLEAQYDAGEQVASAERQQIHASAAVKSKEAQEKAWGILLAALGLNSKALKEDSRAGGFMGLVNMMYLMVIVGCELDLYGFGMAYSSYWALDILTLRILLIICPVGYFLAVGMYMAWNQEDTDESPRRIEASPALSMKFDRTPSSAPAAGQCNSSLSTREPISLQLYHFIPIIRYYLVVKDKTSSDIEGIFRVNSLSSFSLGIAQICGILFQVFVAREELTIFVKINIGSQVLNWLITIMYFMTPISARMKTAVKVDALKYNSDAELHRKYEQYLQLTAAYASNTSHENLAAASDVEKAVEVEINRLCKTNVDFTPYETKIKFDALYLIRRKSYIAYSNIGR